MHQDPESSITFTFDRNGDVRKTVIVTNNKGIKKIISNTKNKTQCCLGMILLIVFMNFILSFIMLGDFIQKSSH
jgi:hypothetical protein